ncbi:MAG: DUF4360 domain-containing protein [Pseudomonadota bacterium]|nr:DUF4360 domain-containing protein [Pseudomonadota bacterium]
MKVNILKLTSAMLVSMSLNAMADDISIGHPDYGGSGCPGGTVSTTLSPDQKSLSVLFDQYVAEAGGGTGKSLDRKSCNVAVPVHIPQGYSISVFQVDYRGFRSIPFGGQGQFRVEYFFAGAQGPILGRSFRGGEDGDYILTHDLEAHAIVWSACGADTNLRINSSVLARTNRNMDTAMATVDTIDVKSGLVFSIQWRRCQ